MLQVLAAVLGKHSVAPLIKPYKAEERKWSSIRLTSLYTRWRDA